MNGVVPRLLGDYARRTLGVWLLLCSLQTMQTVEMWVYQVDRLPLVGVVVAAMAYFATFDSPRSVMRTLPISEREVARVRWWQFIGLPTALIAVSVLVAYESNTSTHFPVPPFTEIWVPMFASFAALGILSVLPLPALSATRSNFPWFVIFWGPLLLLSLYGLPLKWLPGPLPAALGLGGLATAAASFVLARSGRVVGLRVPADVGSRQPSRLRASGVERARLRGWSVLLARWSKTTALLALVSIVAVSAVRHFFPSAGMALALPMIFVSATGAAGTILSRRWYFAVRALQCLPIKDSTLAIIACGALIAPVLVTNLAATLIQWMVPQWGIAVPLYLLPVFAVIPALSVPWHKVESSGGIASTLQRWSPVLQVAAWPLWTGAFMSFALTKLMPVWFDLLALGMAVVLAVVAYAVILVRIRSGQGFEPIAAPFAPR